MAQQQHRVDPVSWDDDDMGSMVVVVVEVVVWVVCGWMLVCVCLLVSNVEDGTTNKL